MSQEISTRGYLTEAEDRGPTAKASVNPEEKKDSMSGPVKSDSIKQIKRRRVQRQGEGPKASGRGTIE